MTPTTRCKGGVKSGPSVGRLRTTARALSGLGADARRGCDVAVRERLASKARGGNLRDSVRAPLLRLRTTKDQPMNEEPTNQSPEMLVDLVDWRGIPKGGQMKLSEARAKGRGYRSFHVWILRETEDGRIEALLRSRSAAPFRRAKGGSGPRCDRSNRTSASSRRRTTSDSRERRPTTPTSSLTGTGSSHGISVRCTSSSTDGATRSSGDCRRRFPEHRGPLSPASRGNAAGPICGGTSGGWRRRGCRSIHTWRPPATGRRSRGSP